MRIPDENFQGRGSQIKNVTHELLVISFIYSYKMKEKITKGKILHI